MTINKQMAKAITQRILDLSKDAIKKEFGLDMNRSGGSFSDTELTLKYMIAVPVSEIKAPKYEVDDAMVKSGLAPRGTVVIVGGKEYTVLKSRRTKYSIQDKDGKTWLANFEYCRLKGAKEAPAPKNNKRTGQDRFAGLPKEAVDAFGSLENRLSPENLACDGEIPQSEVTKRYRQCMREWSALEKRYGVSIEPYV